ncbi:ABC-2 transporter permease, partial [Bacteroidota bacterium]
MIHLIKKDFLIGRYSILSLVLLVPFVTSMAILSMIDYFDGIILGVFVILSIIMSIFCSLIFINIDTSNRGDELIKSLPIDKSIIVYSRFITSFFMEISCLLLIYLASLFFDRVINIEDQNLSLIINYRGIIIALFGISMILLTMLPFIFKYGGGKGSGMIFFSLMFIVLLPSLSKLLLDAFKDSISFNFDFITEKIKDILNYLSEVDPIFIYLI